MILQRSGSRLQNLDQFQSLPSTREWLCAALDAVEKVLTLELQWFLLLEMGDVAVAVVIRIMKFGEGVIVGWTLTRTS